MGRARENKALRGPKQTVFKRDHEWGDGSNEKFIPEEVTSIKQTKAKRPEPEIKWLRFIYTAMADN